MPTMERQVKMVKEALDTIASSGMAKEAVSAALTEIQEFVQEKIDGLANDNDD
jgi:hypothetical protein